MGEEGRRSQRGPLRRSVSGRGPDRIADRVASYFVPVIITLTIIVFIVWVAVGVAVRGKSGSEATVDAITYAITVLIVSCPCAIGLAVPMVVVITSGVAAESGVIFKSASAIEVAHKTSHVVFDKTGTLTIGRPVVVATKLFTGLPLPHFYSLVAAVEVKSMPLIVFTSWYQFLLSTFG